MSLIIATPSNDTQYEHRGAILRVNGVAGGPLELRVDDGLVFARYFGQEPRVWCDVALASVMDFFVADSPIAAFLREQGALPLRQLLIDVKTTGSAHANESTP